MADDLTKVFLDALRGRVIRAFARACRDNGLANADVTAFEADLSLTLWRFDANRSCFCCVGVAGSDRTSLFDAATSDDPYIFHAGAAHLGLCWQSGAAIAVPSMLRSTRSVELHADHRRGLAVDGPSFIFPLKAGVKKVVPAVGYATLASDRSLPTTNERWERIVETFLDSFDAITADIARVDATGSIRVSSLNDDTDDVTRETLPARLVDAWPSAICAVHRLPVAGGQTRLGAPVVQEDYMVARWCALIQRSGVYERAARSIKQRLDSFSAWNAQPGRVPKDVVHAVAASVPPAAEHHAHPSLLVHDCLSYFVQFGIMNASRDVEAVISLNCGIRPCKPDVVAKLSATISKYGPGLARFADVLSRLRRGRANGVVPLCSEIASQLLREFLRALHPFAGADAAHHPWACHVRDLTSLLDAAAVFWSGLPKTAGTALPVADLKQLVSKLDAAMFEELSVAVQACEPVLVSGWLRDASGFQLVADGDDADWIRVSRGGAAFDVANASWHQEQAYANLTRRRDTYPLIQLTRILDSQNKDTWTQPIAPVVASLSPRKLIADQGHVKKFVGIDLPGTALHILRPTDSQQSKHATLAYVRRRTTAGAAGDADFGERYLIFASSNEQIDPRPEEWVEAAAAGKAHTKPGETVAVAKLKRSDQEFDLVGAHVYAPGRLRQHEIDAHDAYVKQAKLPAVSVDQSWLPAVPLVVRLGWARKNGLLKNDFVALARYVLDPSGTLSPEVAQTARNLLEHLGLEVRSGPLPQSDAEWVERAGPYVRVLLELTRGLALPRRSADFGDVDLEQKVLGALGPQALVKYLLIRPVLEHGTVTEVLLVLAATAGLDELGERDDMPPLSPETEARKFIEHELWHLADKEERFAGLPSQCSAVRDAAVEARNAADQNLVHQMRGRGIKALVVCERSWHARVSLLRPEAVEHAKPVVIQCSSRERHRCVPHPGGWVLADSSPLLDAALLAASDIYGDIKDGQKDLRYSLDKGTRLIGASWMARCADELKQNPHFVETSDKEVDGDLAVAYVTACLCRVVAGAVSAPGSTPREPSNNNTQVAQKAVVGTCWNTFRKTPNGRRTANQSPRFGRDLGGPFVAGPAASQGA